MGLIFDDGRAEVVERLVVGVPFLAVVAFVAIGFFIGVVLMGVYDWVWQLLTGDSTPFDLKPIESLWDWVATNLWWTLFGAGDIEVVPPRN